MGAEATLQHGGPGMARETRVSAADVGTRAERDAALDGLRGLAAVMVFYNHLLTASVGRWTPSFRWTWPVSGTAAVLVFFALSGYVIGLGHRARARIGGVKHYFWRRLVRLVPINFAGVLLACAVADAVDLPTALGNLFFLENFCDYAGHWMPVLSENSNLWSLNYEVLFYLLFAVIWAARLPLRWAVGMMVAVGALGWFRLGVPVFVACYAFGFLFWLGGLALAWHADPAESERSNWPTCLLLAFVTWKLQATAELLLAIGPPAPRFGGPVVKLYYLDLLPACVWLVAAVSRRTFAGFALVRYLAAIIPLAGLVIRGALAAKPFETELVALLFIYLLALGLWRWRPSTRLFEVCAPLGSISYALYATARPIQSAVFHAGRHWPANAWTYTACAAVTVVIAFGVAWYLERRLQPALSAALRR